MYEHKELYSSNIINSLNQNETVNFANSLYFKTCARDKLVDLSLLTECFNWHLTVSIRNDKEETYDDKFRVIMLENTSEFLSSD